MADPKIIYENSYQLEPETQLTRPMIRPWVQKALEKQFSSWSYDPKMGGSKSRETCAMIQNFIMDNANVPPRFKLVTQVFIVPLKGQGVRLATRSIWSPSTDNLISESFKGNDYTATALVFYTYNE